MKTTEEIKAILNARGTPFHIVDHPHAFSTAEADRYIEGMDGARTKSVFITNKKRTNYYLVVLDDQKDVDLKALRKELGETRLSLASADRIADKMDSKPGIVTIFSLLDNKERDIHVIFDREMIESEASLTFTPNDNSKTLFLPTQDALEMLRELGYNYQLMDF